MGETCGGRLVYDTHPDKSLCKYCLEIERKKRRYEKACSDYERWRSATDRQASAAKAAEDIKHLWAEIQRLQQARQERYTDLGSRRVR